jgi:SAM-dependent methyltransferase
MIDDKLQQHRNVWACKPVLRRVYQQYFDKVLARIAALEPIVELGSGPGFFKEYHQSLIATDIEATQWTDMVADGCALPFSDGGVGNLVMIDVFHHLARPGDFLHEASRVLRPGGRLVMLEPWTSPVGYRFYRHVHHEDADRNADPATPFAGDKHPFDGNAALPELYFTARGHAQPRGHLRDRLHLLSVERFVAMSWLLSGGFRPYHLLPLRLFPLIARADRWTGPIARWLALRAVITLERPKCASPVSAPQEPRRLDVTRSRSKVTRGEPCVAH